MKRKLLVVFPLLALAIAGCSGNRGGESSNPSGESGTATTTTPSTPTGPSAPSTPSTPSVDPAKFGTLDNPISIKSARELIDELIDYDSIESGKSKSYTGQPIFAKAKVTGNTALNDNKEINYLNVVDTEDSTLELTGYYAVIDASVTEDFSAKDSMVGREIVIKGYAALMKHSTRGKVYELVKKDNDNKPTVMSVSAAPYFPEPDKIAATLKEIVDAVPTKSQAYISQARIKSWADNSGAASETKSQYGNLILETADAEIFVYGASGVATDLAWNESIGEYKMSNSKAFLTNEITKDLVPGDVVDFWGIHFTYNTLHEMNIIITGKVEVEPTSVLINIEEDELLVGAKLELDATVEPETASQEVIWTIEEGADYAEIIEGELLGKAAGEVTLRATAAGYPDVYAEKEITIVEPTEVLVESIEADPSSVNMTIGDDPVALSLTILPVNYEEEISWTIIEGEDVIELNEDHEIVALAVGTAKVRIEGASSHNGTTVDVRVSPELTDLADVYAAALKESTEEFAFRGVVTSITGNSFTLQDDGCGILIYNYAALAEKKLGDVVEIVSTVKLYNGCPQSNVVSSASVVEEGSLPAEEAIASQAELDALNHGVLVKADNAVFVSKNKTWSGSQTVQFKFTLGEDLVTVSADKFGYDETKGALLNGAKEGDVFNLGMMYTSAYSGVAQFAFAGSSTVEKVEIPATGVSFAEELYEVAQGSSKDMAKEIVFEPAGASAELAYSIKEDIEGIEIDEAGLLTVAEGVAVDTEVTVLAYLNELTYASTTVKVTEAVVGKTYTLCEDATLLEAGATIVLTNEDGTVGMKNYEDGNNNCRGTEVTVEADVITNLGEAGEILLEDAGNGHFYLKSGELYLYAAASSSNHLKAKAAKDDANGVWEFSYTAEGKMSIVAVGSTNRNVLRFNPNNGSPIFSCYENASKQSNVQVYLGAEAE